MKSFLHCPTHLKELDNMVKVSNSNFNFKTGNQYEIKTLTKQNILYYIIEQQL